MFFKEVLLAVVVFAVFGISSAVSFVDDQTLREVKCDENTDNKQNKENLRRLYKKFTQKYTGRVTYFGDYPYGITTCMLDPLPPMQRSVEFIRVAVSSKEYMGSLACGSCLKLTPRNEVLKRNNVTSDDVSVDDYTKTYYATVVDICQHCKPGEMRLYKDGEGFHDIIYEAIPCKELTGAEGLLKMKFSACKNDDKRMKVQIKNMKIPVAQMELFQGQKWSCVKRGRNNYYLFHDLQNATFPIRGRVTAIDGQILGFSLDEDALKDQNEVFLPSQFGNFNYDKLDRLPFLKCYEGNETFHKNTNKSSSNSKTSYNRTSSEALLRNSSRATAAEQNILSDFVNSTTKKPVDNENDNKKNKTIPEKQPKQNLLCEGPINNGFLGNCDKYLACENGRATMRSCPKGFSYDTEKMKCDKRGACLLTGTLKKSSEEDDIYTKRFT